MSINTRTKNQKSKMKWLSLTVIIVLITAQAMAWTATRMRKPSGGGGGGGGGGTDCTIGVPSTGTLCNDGTYFVGQVTINGSTYKLATTPGNCGYEPSGSASTVVSSSFTPTCSGGNDTMTKNATSITLIAGGDEKGATTDGSTVTGAVASNLYIGTPAASYCEYMNFGGHTDWFLPNKSELHFLACRSTTSANPLFNANNDAACGTYSYGSGSNVVPGFKSGKDHPAGYSVYTSSSTATWSGSTFWMDTTINGAASGEFSWLTVGNPYLVRCLRVIP